MSDKKPLTLPISGGDLEQEARLFDENTRNVDLMDDPTKFRSMIGKLMYAMVATRPDIAFATNFASRFMHLLSHENFRLVKRIWRYVMYIVNVGLKFKRNDGWIRKILQHKLWQLTSGWKIVGGIFVFFI